MPRRPISTIKRQARSLSKKTARRAVCSCPAGCFCFPRFQDSSRPLTGCENSARSAGQVVSLDEGLEEPGGILEGFFPVVATGASAAVQADTEEGLEWVEWLGILLIRVTGRVHLPLPNGRQGQDVQDPLVQVYGCRQDGWFLG
jgi:hypothetical protein